MRLTRFVPLDEAQLDEASAWKDACGTPDTRGIDFETLNATRAPVPILILWPGLDVGLLESPRQPCDRGVDFAKRVAESGGRAIKADAARWSPPSSFPRKQPCRPTMHCVSLFSLALLSLCSALFVHGIPSASSAYDEGEWVQYDKRAQLKPRVGDRSYKTVRGVNLGGWLVLEAWMTPDLFTPDLVAKGAIDQ